MPNLLEIIDRAEQLATGTAQDPIQSVVIDSALTAETIFPHAVRCVLEMMAANGDDLQDVTTVLTLTVDGGSADLPDAVLKETLNQASFPSRPFVSFLPFADYQRSRFDRTLSYFSILGSQFYFTDPDSGDAGFSGDLLVSVAQIPDIPTDITQPVPLQEKIVEAVILTIAKVLRGEMRLDGLN